MQYLKKLWSYLTDDHYFLELVGIVERLVAKILALGMVVVILVAVADLAVFLFFHAFGPTPIFSLIKVFGLFLNVLVAIEILQNITAYLRKHSIQLELVIVTSLTAVARKIIIFDSKDQKADLIGLALASLALAISYWIIKNMHTDPHESS